MQNDGNDQGSGGGPGRNRGGGAVPRPDAGSGSRAYVLGAPRPKLKPLSEQAFVITGASSGIGLVTARLAAEQGARVLLAARNEDDLRAAVDAIRATGGTAEYAVCDVADEAQVRHVAERAIEAFGRIDTWVNNAGLGVYGKSEDVPLEDMRRLFDIVYWGVVHGSLAAVPHLRRQGGALINIASVVADRAVPLQGTYNAAKRAVKGFTDTLRMELEEEGAPVSVSLVKPASIDTPFFDKARSYTGAAPRPVPPVYAPEVVAEVILECAQRPVREIHAGGSGTVFAFAETFAPRLADRMLRRSGMTQQKADPARRRTDAPLPGGSSRRSGGGSGGGLGPGSGGAPDPRGDAERDDNLYGPTSYDGGDRSRVWQGRVRERSVATRGALHPAEALVFVVGIGLAAFALAKGLPAVRPRGR